MKKKYLEKAKKLLNSGFWVAGIGNFDITLDELSILLELIELNNFDEISKLYQKLEEERL